MKRYLAAGLAAVLLMTLAAVWYWHRPQASAGGLTLQGNVDVRQADLAFKVSGRIAEMTLQEGDKVAAGQLLARLEQGNYQAALDQTQGQQASAAAALAELVNGSRPEEIDQAKAQVAQAEAALVNAQLTFKRQKELVKSDFASHSDFDLAEASMREAEAQLASSKAALTLAVKGPRQERIDAARGQLDQAKGAQSLAQQNLADTCLTSPEEGVVMSRVHEPGTIVAAGDTVYSVVFTHPVWIRAYVPEQALDHVRPGQKADVFTDGGRHYTGQVGYVSPLAEFTPKTVQTPEQRAELVYRLRVVVTEEDGNLRQGMPVTLKLDD
jgi:HlyD family secretion protein